jgi:hypothetical protein
MNPSSAAGVERNASSYRLELWALAKSRRNFALVRAEVLTRNSPTFVQSSTHFRSWRPMADVRPQTMDFPG